MKSTTFNIPSKTSFDFKKSKGNEDVKEDDKDIKDINEEEDEKEGNNMLSGFASVSVLKKLVIALSVIIIVICIGFIVYQFYSKRNQQKIDICTQDKISNYERRIDELEQQSNEVIADNTKLAQQITSIQNEYNNYVHHTEQQRKEEYSKKPQVIYKSSSKKKQAKLHQDEYDDTTDNDDYAIEFKQFDDAPVKSKNKKKVNPQQALKNRINEQAKKAYDKKQTAIQRQMDNEDDDEGEQQEIQQQLGLSRNINEKKLMELANEQEQTQQEQLKQAQSDTHKDNNEGVGLNDEVEEIDSSLIV